MKRKDVKKEEKVNHSALTPFDITSNDFQEEQFSFRLPKIGPTEMAVGNISRGRGRPRRNARPQTQITKTNNEKFVNHILPCSQNNPPVQKSILTSPVFELSQTKSTATSTAKKNEVSLWGLDNKGATQDDSIDKSPNYEDLEDHLTELEKSVCSSSEKLCPSCKHIVCSAEYPDHFSTCLQKFKFSKTVKKKEAEDGIDASPRILPCPVCLKTLTSASERRAHIKACGSDHGLSTEQLILASRLQEKQAEERLSLGLPSLQVAPNPNVNKKSKGPGPRPKAVLDPDLQLAVALSRSLAEAEKDQHMRKEDELVSLGLEDVLQEERRTLVLPQPPPMPGRRGGSRSKAKRQGRPQTTLMLRTSEDREQIITEKVAALLVDEKPEGITSSLPRQLCHPRKPGYLDLYLNKDSPLWKFGSSTLAIPLESHFVSELAEFIKPQSLPVGELLKSLSQVPGRLNYSALAEDFLADERIAEEEVPVESTIVDLYCTQLALAEMLGTQEMVDLTFNTDVDVEVNIAQSLAAFDDDEQKEKTSERVTEKECEGRQCLQEEVVVTLNSKEGCERVSDSQDNTCLEPLPISPQSDSSSSNTHPLHLSPVSKPTKPIADVDSDFPLHAKLVYDWSRLLASGDHSDITIITIDADIPVHSLVLSVRCPAILQEMGPVSPRRPSEREDSVRTTSSELSLYSSKRQIEWSLVTYEAAYSFMVYLYSGVCTVNSKENEVWMALFDLSLKYQCQELVSHLENIYKITPPEKKETLPQTVNGSKTPSETHQIQSQHSPNSILKESVMNGTLPVHSTVPENLNRTLSFSPEPDLDPNVKHIPTPTSEGDTLNGIKYKSAPTSTVFVESPDIFGEWFDKNTSNIYAETSLTSSPQKHFRKRSSPLSRSVSSSPSRLSAPTTGKKLSFDDEDDDIVILSDSVEIVKTGHIPKDKSPKKISSDLEKPRLSLMDENESHTPPRLIEATPDKLSPNHSDLLPSPFSDLSYPSGNEFFDFVSDDLVDAPSTLDPVPSNGPGHLCISPVACTPPSRKEEITLSDLPYTNHKADMCSPSNLSALTQGQIKYPSKLRTKLNDPRFPHQGDVSLSSPRKKCSFLLPKRLVLDRNIKSCSEMLSNSFHNLGDDTILHAICDEEFGQLPPQPSPQYAANKKLPKSKSCLDHPNSPKDSGKTFKHRIINHCSPLPSQEKSFSLTPRPDYQLMVSPDLQKELDKFGIRKLSRPKAIKLLLHIYEEMHPIASDSEAEASYSKHCSPRLILPPSPPKETSKAKEKLKLRTKKIGSCENSVEDENPNDVLNSSQSSLGSTDSNFECLEESVFPDLSEDDLIPASQQATLDSRLISFIKGDVALYRKILLYEPIWANELHQTLKANGIKCNMAKLIQFLDEQCITFRIPTRERSRKRHRKNSSPNKSPRTKFPRKS